jgi:putative copper resistance protein D
VSGSDAVTVAVRFALYGDLILLFGIAAFALQLRRRSLPWGLMAGGGWIGLAVSAAALWTLAASMAGVPLSGVDRSALGIVLSVPAIGVPFGVRIAALLVVTGLGLLRVRASVRVPAMLAASGVALGSLAFTGHANMDGWVHLLADIAHLIAAAMWIGAIAGLLAMAILAHRAPTADRLDQAWRALHGFARTGTILVGVIALTGLVNIWAIIGVANLPTLPATAYGRLLIAKLILFAAMLALAAANRFAHVPALARAVRAGPPAAALVTLRRSLLAEGGCAVAILLAVAWLGTLDPGGAG